MIIFEQNDLRISLLTPRILRIEKGSFTDLPTQMVINRDFGDVKYSIENSGKSLRVITEEVVFNVSLTDGRVTSAEFDGITVTDFNKGIMLSTARTLDRANGKVKLENGITSYYGAAMLDDSASLLLNPDGTISERPKCSDRYWLCYGMDYLRQLRQFFKLTGEVPLIPKYALGNWWSRYKAYTQEEYRGVMQKFIDRKIPVTVATIDMDWHWTDVIILMKKTESTFRAVKNRKLQ